MFRPPTKYSEYLQDVRKSIDYILKRVNATTVTQIVAGTNVTISPASGTGVVTINASGGGGGGLPAGGTAGQILSKINSVDYNAEWIDNYALWTSTLKHEVKAGEAINKGQAVYVSTADGTNMIVSKASNTSEATSSKTMGLLAQNLATNGKGFVITEGLLAGLNTSGASAGDPVWLGANGDLIFGLINKPYAPLHLVSIGIVTRVNSNNGEIFVKVQNGFELDELHNVDARFPNNNDGIFYNSTTHLWEHKPVSAVYATPTLAQVTTAGNTTTNAITVGGLTVATNLIYTDTINGRVGINTASPLFPLDVLGTAKFASTTSGIIIRDWTAFNTYRAIYKASETPSDLNYLIAMDSDVLINSRGSGTDIRFNGAIRARFGNAFSLRVIGSGTTSATVGFEAANSSSTPLFQVRDNGNVLIGTTTDAGYKLDVNGTARVQSSFTGSVLKIDGTGAATGFEINSQLDNDLRPSYMVFSRGGTQKYIVGHSYGRSGFFISNGTDTVTYLNINLAGNVLVGTTTDSNAKFVVAGSITAASAIARGVYFNNTLVAAANNDVLVGLDINPTFTNGVFTGVTNLGLRSYGGFNLYSQGNGHFLSAVSTTGTDGLLHFRRFSGHNGPIRLQLGGSFLLTSNDSTGEVQMSYGSGYFLTVVANGSEAMRIPTSRNVLIGTTTDSGFKLDVVGADSRFNGVRVGLGAGGVTSNTVVGTNALANNTTGLSNTAVGNGSLRYNIDGAYNTAYGVDSLNANTGGGSNVAVGWRALISSLTAYSNVAIGTQALFSNTASNNTAVGTQAGFSNTSGGVVALGVQALYSNTTGNENTAVGRVALYFNTTGNNNTSTGAIALYTNTTGSNNTANGQGALHKNTTGGFNTAIGSSSLFENTTGVNNVAIGHQAGQAGVANTTGANNIFIGYQATGVSATESNRTWIGNSSTTSTWVGGNLLVGTTTNAGYKLDVNGTARVKTDLKIETGTGGLTIEGDASGYPTLSINTLRSGVDRRNWKFATEQVNAGDFIFYRSSTGGGAANTVVYAISKDGNFGLGTTTPTDKFHIVDNTNGNKFARISAGGTDASAAWVAQNDQVDNVVYRVFGSAVTGSQMGQALARSASLIVNLGGTGKFLIGSYSSTDLIFGTGDQARMRLVDSTGNFLIGTMTDTGNKLTVSGNIDAQGYKVGNVLGFTGIFNVPTNPPGQQNIDIQGGIVVNIF